MAELIVVTGPPGAGKSTVAELLSEQFDRSAVVAGDTFFGFLREGSISAWLPESHEQNTVVVEAAAAAAGRLARHCNVVYDGVVGPWFLPNFVNRSGLDWISYALLLPPLDVCLHRIAARSGHGFTDLDAAKSMWHQFAQTRIDARYVLSGVTPAAHLARRIAERTSSAHIRYPSES